jgi:predicted aldo/keto reductase-like oxidoreductase
MAQQQFEQSQQVPAGEVPKKPLGRTGVQVSAMGLGGYHLGSAETDQAAMEIVAKAFDHGVRFFDDAWEYHDGLSEERLGKALRGKRDQAFVMTKVCTRGRDKKIAMRMLEESLRRLQTDHLDLWQIHEVVYDNDPELIFAPDGAAEALLAAKQQGKVRFIGFTGHKDPEIHLKMLSHDFAFDTVQMPLNCCDATFRSFETHVLPEATRRGIAGLGLEESRRQRRARPPRRCYSRTGLALCHESSGGHHDQRRGHDTSSRSESEGCGEFSAPCRRRDAVPARPVPLPRL